MSKDLTDSNAIVYTQEQLDRRQEIQDFEDKLKEDLKGKPSGMMTTHHFANGCYVREIYLPKGYQATGKIHRHPYINILSKGKVVVITEKGQRLIEAPCTWVGSSGVKAVAYAVEDTIWCNVHPDYGTQDLDEIERNEIAEDFETLEEEWATGKTDLPIVYKTDFKSYKDTDGSVRLNEHLKITLEGSSDLPLIQQEE